MTSPQEAGLAAEDIPLSEPPDCLKAKMWTPRYARYIKAV